MFRRAPIRTTALLCFSGCAFATGAAYLIGGWPFAWPTLTITGSLAIVITGLVTLVTKARVEPDPKARRNVGRALPPILGLAMLPLFALILEGPDALVPLIAVLAVVLILVGTIAAITLAARLSPKPPGVACPECGYDLAGLVTDRCPECGRVLDGETRERLRDAINVATRR